MSEAKHSPAPWSDKRLGFATFIYSDAQPNIAAVHANDSIEGQSNARLIVAAPELLAALTALKLECLSDVLNPCWGNRPTDKPGLHWGSEPGTPVPACSSCVAKAAIAKATGAIA